MNFLFGYVNHMKQPKQTRSLFSIACVVLCLAFVSGCGGSESTSGGLAGTSNGTATSNGTTATSNGTTATSNGTTATSNGTTATSNGTTATSNGTTSTSNGTTATSNGTTNDAGMDDTGIVEDTGTSMDTGVEMDLPPDSGEPEDMSGEDTAADTTVEDEPDMAEPCEEVAMEDRPEVLAGGVSLVEAVVIANFLIRFNIGNIGVAFAEPEEEEEPIMTIGDCDVINASLQDDLFGQLVGYDAGPITIAAGDYEPVEMSAERNEENMATYPPAFSDETEEAYPEDSEIAISTCGGPHVGPFSGTVRSPVDYTITTPLYDTTIGAGALPVTWTDVEADEVQVTISPLDNNYTPIEGIGLSCRVSQGSTFEIPAEAMAQLNAPRLGVSVIAANTVEVESDPDSILLNATRVVTHLITYSP